MTDFFIENDIGCVVKSPEDLMESLASGIDPFQEMYTVALNKLSVVRALNNDRLVSPIREGDKTIGLFFVRSGIKIIV